MIQSLPSAGRQYVSNHLTTDSLAKSCERFFELLRLPRARLRVGKDRNLRRKLTLALVGEPPRSRGERFSIGRSCESIPCGLEVVCAFFWGEEIADLADGVPEFVDGAHGHGAQVRLEFGEGHFDRIEVGAVGRQKHKPSASLADGLFGRGAFVGGQVVQNDDVAFFEGRGELGLDVGVEDRPIHRRVNDPRRGQGAAAQSGDESLGLPMAKGGLGAKALAPVATPPCTGHLRVGSRFVDEDQPMGLGPHLGLLFSLPRLARLAHVGPIAFAGLKAFF